MTPEAMALCAALARAWPPEPALGDEHPPACLYADADLAGRAQITTPDTGVASRFDLPRARVEAAVTGGPGLAARFAMEAVRSVPETGYVGIDGESYVPRIQIAEARFVWAPWGLWIAGGLVDDWWIPRGEQGWGWRPVAQVVSNEQKFLDRADLGASVGWTAPDRLVKVSVTVANGEGLAARERNDGKNVEGIVAARPLAALDEKWADSLVVEGMVRMGSRGFEAARDHRFAVRVHGGIPEVYGGFEWIRALGMGGDPDLRPYGITAWVRTDPWGPLTGFARFDQMVWAPGDPDSHTTITRVGVGTRLPFTQRAPGHLILGWQHDTAGPAAAPVDGAPAAVDADTFYVQVGVRLRGALPLAP